MIRLFDGKVYRDMTPEEEEQWRESVAQDPNYPGPTLESLDHRLSDVEYIITGEVVTNAQ